MTDDITTELATASDIMEFYGSAVPQTLRAISFKVDGVIMGITGITRIDNKMLMFSDIKDDFIPYLRSMPVLRTIKEMQRKAIASMLPVYATSDEQFGPHLLERMGFEQVEGDIYVWVH